MRLHLFLFLCLISSSLFAKSDFVLCLEGGGTKTTLLVLDQKGQLISLIKNGCKSEKIETSGTNINTIGKEGVKNALESLFANVQIANDSRLLTDILPTCQLVAGMAGAGLPKNKQNLKTLFEELGFAKENLFVMSDAELALELIDDKGIILIAGTGSVCFGKENQKTFRVGGLGYVLGDEGSGYQIGLQALKASLAEEYGWGKPTSLTSVLKAFFQKNDLKSLIVEINSKEFSPAKIASSAPLVFKEASKGDLVAKEIIERSAKELGQLLALQIKMSNLSDCDVHLWGGLFKNPQAEAYIQKIIEYAGVSNKNIKIINQSEENVAVIYASKFLFRARI